MKQKLIDSKAVLEAYEVLKPIVLRTPLQYDFYLSRKYGAKIYLKREDLQKVRSFKLRGASYAIKRLPSEVLANGVVCASAGNHAQGVAYICNELGVKAVIFMPSTTPAQKISQVAFFGGDFVEIRLTGDNFDSSASAAKEFASSRKMTFINPFDDLDIIAGQGTLAVEIFEDLKEANEKADILLCAIGGGGLISGVAGYAKSAGFQTKIIGVEPSGATSMKKALECGKPVKLEQIDKFVDGAAVAEVGELTYLHTKEYVDSVIHVDEGLVCCSILDLYSKQAIVAEPAGALSVAALEVLKDEIKGKVVVCVISGGNNDIKRMGEIEERSLVFQGVMNYFIVNFPQRAGALKEFVTQVLGQNDDVMHFEYTKKTNRSTGPVVLGVLSKSKEDVPGLLKRIESFDKNFIQLKDDKSLYRLFI